MSKSENKIAELEKEAQQASKKTSEFRNKAELAKNTAQTHLETIKKLNTTANSELSKLQEAKEESASINNDLKNKKPMCCIYGLNTACL